MNADIERREIDGFFRIYSLVGESPDECLAYWPAAWSTEAAAREAIAVTEETGETPASPIVVSIDTGELVEMGGSKQAAQDHIRLKAEGKLADSYWHDPAAVLED